MIQNLSKIKSIFHKRSDKQTARKPSRITRYDLLKDDEIYRTLRRNESCNSKHSRV